MTKILAVEASIYDRLAQEQLQEVQWAAADEYIVQALDALSYDVYADIHIAWGPVSYDAIGRMPQLRWLALASAGVEKRNERSRYLHPDFVMTNGTGVYGQCISEHVLAMMLCLQRGLHLYRDHQKRHAWAQEPIRMDFEGATVAVVGLGDIGTETARKCAALGARVLAVKRTPAPKPDFVHALYFDLEESLDRILAEADFIALCLPHTNDTEGILNARRLSLIKEHAVLVNIGRGALIDQEALIGHLQHGRFTAGLDVMTPEPLDESSPLWDLPNVLITPHMAGRSGDRIKLVHELFVQNLGRFMRGDTLDNLVDFDAGY